MPAQPPSSVHVTLEPQQTTHPFQPHCPRHLGSSLCLEHPHPRLTPGPLQIGLTHLLPPTPVHLLGGQILFTADLKHPAPSGCAEVLTYLLIKELTSVCQAPLPLRLLWLPPNLFLQHSLPVLNCLS